LYTEEINAAVRGAKEAGATEIVVMDCHGAGGAYDFNSLVPDLLDPDCEYVVQQEWTEYTAFLESGCDAALFVGMHAMAGAAGGAPSGLGRKRRAGAGTARTRQRRPRSPTSRPSRPTTRAGPARSRSTSLHPTGFRNTRIAKASRSQARAASPSAATTGGRP